MNEIKYVIINMHIIFNCHKKTIQIVRKEKKICL